MEAIHKQAKKSDTSVSQIGAEKPIDDVIGYVDKRRLGFSGIVSLRRPETWHRDP